MAFAEDYVDVATRIVQFREKFPNGSLQPVDPMNPLAVMQLGDRTFLVYKAAAYRTPDDERPGIGIAWEQFPGKTPYTRDSEAMVCETSAWGRAIVAALAADTKKGVASADEVRNRQAERDEPVTDPLHRNQLVADIKARADHLGWTKDDVASDFSSRCDGKDILHGTEKELEVYLDWLNKQPSKWETNSVGEPA